LQVAKNVEEASPLIEAGFEYVCDFNGAKLFRKTQIVKVQLSLGSMGVRPRSRGWELNMPHSSLHYHYTT
jgi:hypothetical protein